MRTVLLHVCVCVWKQQASCKSERLPGGRRWRRGRQKPMAVELGQHDLPWRSASGFPADKQLHGRRRRDSFRK